MERANKHGIAHNATGGCCQDKTYCPRVTGKYCQLKKRYCCMKYEYIAPPIHVDTCSRRILLMQDYIAPESLVYIVDAI